jgi:hypothetical protein
MAMRKWLMAAVGAVLVTALGGEAQANDTVRLGGPGVQSDIQGGTDTELVRWGRGFYGRGHHGGYGHGHYGARYYTPYFSVGYYSRPYYGGGYYRPYYYSSYYYRPYYYDSYYYYPCAGEAAPLVTAQVQIAPTPKSQQYVPQLPQPQPYVPPMPPAGNFQYDGGPAQPVPMPNSGPDLSPARGIVPIDGKLVSLPTGITGGFSPVGVVTNRVTNPAPRINYPAYGER